MNSTAPPLQRSCSFMSRTMQRLIFCNNRSCWSVRSRAFQLPALESPSMIPWKSDDGPMSN